MPIDFVTPCVSRTLSPLDTHVNIAYVPAPELQWSFTEAKILLLLVVPGLVTTMLMFWPLTVLAIVPLRAGHSFGASTIEKFEGTTSVRFLILLIPIVFFARILSVKSCPTVAVAPSRYIDICPDFGLSAGNSYAPAEAGVMHISAVMILSIAEITELIHDLVGVFMFFPPIVFYLMLYEQLSYVFSEPLFHIGISLSVYRIGIIAQYE